MWGGRPPMCLGFSMVVGKNLWGGVMLAPKIFRAWGRRRSSNEQPLRLEPAPPALTGDAVTNCVPGDAA